MPLQQSLSVCLPRAADAAHTNQLTKDASEHGDRLPISGIELLAQGVLQNLALGPSNLGRQAELTLSHCFASLHHLERRAILADSKRDTWQGESGDIRRKPTI